VVDDVNELPALQGPPGAGLGEVIGEDGQPVPALEANSLDARLEEARRLARENPLAMATLLRGWVNN